IDGVHADGFFKVAQLARGEADGELPVIAINRDPGGIVSAIFQALQAFQNNRNGAMGTNVTDNSTHDLFIIRAAIVEPAGAVGRKPGTDTKFPARLPEIGCLSQGLPPRASPRQSRISTRYSSMTGLANTSWAIVSMSVCACCREMPLESAISKNLPWRTSVMAANPRPWSAAHTAWPCGSRTVDLGVTNTRAFMGTPIIAWRAGRTRTAT